MPRAMMVALLLLAVSGCAGASSSGLDSQATPPASATPWVTLAPGVSPEPLRTFVLYSPPAGSALACPAYLISPNVSGMFVGSPSDAERIWLVGPSGRISVIWPAGFTLVFTPDATLFDGTGALFARAGEGILLGQVRAGSHAGTSADPYLAAGLIEAKAANGDVREACVPAADGEPYPSP